MTGVVGLGRPEITTYTRAHNLAHSSYGLLPFTARALGVAGLNQTISKLGTFFEKYVPHSMPIFEKKSHLIRPVEGLKLCFYL